MGARAATDGKAGASRGRRGTRTKDTPAMWRKLPARRTRVVGLLATGAALAVGGLTALTPIGATASSHAEAPLISGQPQYDNTDVYAFVSPDKPDTTTLIA